jgi:peptidoglycan/LPS O-acetylase OafA/YrhL
MTATGQSTQASGRDTYVGGLDGLRAIAVAAVIVFHFAPTVLPAGFLGVDVFFVVSGFLIARLVVREIAASGTVSRRDFWARRARRLLPALATVTVVVLIASAIVLSNVEIHDLRAQALGTLFYCVNWVIIHQNGNYFATLGRPSPFLHMWTLAVEEQFYIVLPLVFFATRRALVRHPVRASVIALIGAVASTIWMAVLFSPTGDPTRAYIGSDSHAMGLLVGVAIGVLAGAGRPWDVFTRRVQANRNATRIAPVLAAAALIVILVTMRVADDHSTWLFRGGFLVFALLCAVIVAVLVSMPEARISRVLRIPALVAIGVRSYSLYLWHWPVRVFVTPSSGLHGAALFFVRLAISVVLAEISYRLIEQPFRVGALSQKWGSRGALTYFGVLTVVAAGLVMTVASPDPLPPSSLAQGNGGPSGSSQLRVDLFGDSTGLVFGLGGRSASDQLALSVGGDAQLGCGLVQAGHVTGGQVVKSPSYCGEWATRWRAAMRNDPGARLAVMAGAWEVFDQKTASGVVRFGTPAWTDLITTSTRRALDVLTADGRTVYLFEVPCYGAGDGTNTLLTERGDPKRVDAVNAIFAKVAREVPHVEIVHWRTLVCPGGHRAETVNGVDLFLADQQHLTNAGAVEVWKWWLPQLRAAP